MTIECETSIQIQSERVVPRQGRAAWLERHGIPGEFLEFCAKAPAALWEGAGCHLSVTGKVIKLSPEAIDALCVPARRIVRELYPVNQIPDSDTCAALTAAAETRQRTISKQAEQRTEGEQAKERAAKWAMQHGSITTKTASRGGYDVRSLVLEEIRGAFERFLEVPCLITRKDEKDMTPRSTARWLALENQEVIGQAIEEFGFPNFVNVTMRGLYRTRFEDSFITVVVVKFEIAGVAPIICAWNAEEEM